MPEGNFGDYFLNNLWTSIGGPLLFEPLGWANYLPKAPSEQQDTPEGVRTARMQLGLATIAITGLVAAPAVYAAYIGKKRRKAKAKASVERMGMALENASAQMTGLMMTAIAAPAISTAAAYIGVQKLEDAHIISRGLGNAAQGLLTVAAAGPAIAGIGQVAQSAFLKGK